MTSDHRKRVLLIMSAVVLIALVSILGPRACYFVRYGGEPHSLSEKLLNVDRSFAFPPGFVQDPGPGGRENLMGIDSDHDGVRDDVQRWIFATFPSDASKRGALRQLARFYQDSLREDFGPEVRKENIRIMRRAVDCQFKVFRDEIHGYTEAQHLKARMLNTRERTSRFLENDWKVTTPEMAGTRIWEKKPCDDH